MNTGSPHPSVQIAMTDHEDRVLGPLYHDQVWLGLSKGLLVSRSKPLEKIFMACTSNRGDEAFQKGYRNLRLGSRSSVRIALSAKSLKGRVCAAQPSGYFATAFCRSEQVGILSNPQTAMSKNLENSNRSIAKGIRRVGNRVPRTRRVVALMYRFKGMRVLDASILTEITISLIED
jgi:hypothetical protein